MHYTLWQMTLIWVLGCGALSFLLKDQVLLGLSKLSYPRLVKFFILTTPLILIEEFLTCEIAFLSCIKVTLPAFSFLLWLFVYLLNKWKKLPYLLTSLIFGLMGWVNEFILVGRIHWYPLKIILIVSPITVLIYAVLAILPAYYLSRSRD
jgi:hypothetical protein